jgi:phenylpropionate dioxygenase-like ring-hydroxylating dioxygenase large terminal subunit
VGARSLPESIDQDSYGLKPAATEVLEGLIFICLAPGPEPWSLMGRYRELLSIHGLAEAKIAARRSYPTDANLKLVVENFLECYHCPPAHPEFMRVSSPALNEAYGRGHGEFAPQALRELEAFRIRTERLGCPSGFLPHDSLNLGFGIRKPLREGWCSTSPDGKALAPLMGRFKESDGGSTVIGFNPFSYVYGV